MTIPNFLIIGAAKAGTSSLYYYLQQHPQIYMSPLKEPKFFALKGKKLNFQGPDKVIVNRTSVNTFEAYEQLFQDATNEVAIGEASPIYLYSKCAAENIKTYKPSAKLIVVLRDPVDRAFSSFSHLIREGYETLTFAEALQEEPIRIAHNWAPLWHYKEKGYYYRQLKRYFDRFSRDNIKIYLFEDLLEDSQSVVKNIFQFLDVEENFIPDMTKQNISGVPKNRFIHSLFTRDNLVKTALKPLFPHQKRKQIRSTITEYNMRDKPRLSMEVREDLIDIYRADILQLQDLIQRDLSKWLE